MNASDSGTSTPESGKPLRLYGSACDTCRRRRIKCDCGQPCERCAKSNVVCTYGSLTNRTSAVSYARHLEQKVAELEELLRSRPRAESGEHESIISTSQETARQQAIDMLVGPEDDYVFRIPESTSNVFYGRFGGMSVLRSIGDMAAASSHTAHRISSGRELVEAFEVSTIASQTVTQPKMFVLLPPKQQVLDYTRHAIRTALVCHDCIDSTQFSRQLDNLYESDFDDYSLDDRKLLALVYALMALGRRWSSMSTEDEINESDDKDKLKGLNYFHISFEILNTTDFRGLDYIRAVICQAKYLLSACMISRAHSHISFGTAAALRMGLHVSSPAEQASFPPEEILQRRRVFSTLNMMDTYLSNLLGLPKSLNHIDQRQVLGLSDEQLLDQGQEVLLHDISGPFVETIFCQQLNDILAKVLDFRLSIINTSGHMGHETYSEMEDFVMMRQAEMQQWHDNLPAMPEAVSDTWALRAQLTLRLWYASAQVTLYRPFLHHLARDKNDPKFSLRGYEFGSACVQAAMQALWVNEAFQTNNILHEASDLSLYTLGFAATILAFFIGCSSHRATVEESSVAARKAIDLLEILGKYNHPAKRCSTALKVMVHELPTMSQQTDDIMIP